jgi:hypothetical protein
MMRKFVDYEAVTWDGDIYCNLVDGGCLSDEMYRERKPYADFIPIYKTSVFTSPPRCSKCNRVIESPKIIGKDFNPEEHAKMFIVKQETPFDGCWWKKGLIFLLWDDEKNEYIVKQSLLDGKYEGMFKEDVHSEYDLIRTFENYPLIYDIAFLDDEKLFLKVPDHYYAYISNFYWEFCSDDVKPFIWRCSECGEEQNEGPYDYDSFQGCGGMGIEMMDPMCVSCMKD